MSKNGDKNDDDDDDDDDGNSKGAEVVEIATSEALTMVDRLVKLKYPSKEERNSCHHETQIREDKGAEQKAKPYEWLLYAIILFF